MTRPISVALPFAAALALGGCATAVPPVEVTRFHTNAVAGWAPGTRYAIATDPLDAPGTFDAPGTRPPGAAIPSLEWNSYRAAVDQQLQRQGLGGGPKRMADLQLFVRIDNAATGQALWEGRALTAVPVKAPANQPSLAAAKLAEALFKDFPGESGRTISVK